MIEQAVDWQQSIRETEEFLSIEMQKAKAHWLELTLLCHPNNWTTEQNDEAKRRSEIYYQYKAALLYVSRFRTYALGDTPIPDSRLTHERRNQRRCYRFNQNSPRMKAARATKARPSNRQRLKE